VTVRPISSDMWRRDNIGGVVVYVGPGRLIKMMDMETNVMGGVMGGEGEQAEPKALVDVQREI
jgi:hypothetical protein